MNLTDFNLRLGTKQPSNILHLGSTNQEALSTILRMTPKNQQIDHFSVAVRLIKFLHFYALEEMMYILYLPIFLCIFLSFWLNIPLSWYSFLCHSRLRSCWGKTRKRTPPSLLWSWYGLDPVSCFMDISWFHHFPLFMF